VWVTPELRGRGLGTAGTAAVVRLARETIAPVVSLYVNDYNVPARRAYERIGMRQIGELSSILF
jgi:predicted GNAT family acetyltransferase